MQDRQSCFAQHLDWLACKEALWPLSRRNLTLKLKEANDSNPARITEYRLMEPKHVFCSMYNISPYGDLFRDWATALIVLPHDHVICRFCGIACTDRRVGGKTDHVEGHMHDIEHALEKFVRENKLP